MVRGKYLPSQLRTQKAGPEATTRAAGAAAGWVCCGLRPNGSAKKLACEEAGRFWPPPKNRSNRPSAEALPGASTRDAASDAAAINIARLRMREIANPVRNANSTNATLTH